MFKMSFYWYYIFWCRIFCVRRKIFLGEFHIRVSVASWDHDWHEYSSSLCHLSLTMDETWSPFKKRYEWEYKSFLLFRFTEFEKMLPVYKNISVFVVTKVTNRLKCEYVWKCEVVVPWIYAQVCGGTAWADSLNFSGLGYVLLIL